MALFRRNQTTEIPELKEYYETERRDRPVLAWALALISLLITIAVVLGLFFGGRWLYRTIFEENGDSNNSATQQEEGSESADQADEATGGELSQETAEPAPSTESTGTESSTETPSETGQEQTSTTPPASESTADTTPTTGALPNTGPADIIMIFLITSIVAGSLHYAVNSKKTN